MDNNEIDINNIDMTKLREFLLDYYESAYFCGIDIAQADLIFVEQMDDEELLKYAISRNFDISKYVINKTR